MCFLVPFHSLCLVLPERLTISFVKSLICQHKCFFLLVITYFCIRFLYAFVLNYHIPKSLIPILFTIERQSRWLNLIDSVVGRFELLNHTWRFFGPKSLILSYHLIKIDCTCRLPIQRFDSLNSGSTFLKSRSAPKLFNDELTTHYCPAPETWILTVKGANSTSIYFPTIHSSLSPMNFLHFVTHLKNLASLRLRPLLTALNRLSSSLLCRLSHPSLNCSFTALYYV